MKITGVLAQERARLSRDVAIPSNHRGCGDNAAHGPWLRLPQRFLHDQERHSFHPADGQGHDGE